METFLLGTVQYLLRGKVVRFPLGEGVIMNKIFFMWGREGAYKIVKRILFYAMIKHVS